MSTTPLKSFSSADGKLNGNGEAAENILNAGERAVERRTLAVELVDENGAGQIELVGEAPDLFGLDFDAGHAIDNHQCGVGGDQRGFGVVKKNIKARGVEEIDFLFGPLGERDAGGNGDLALDLFVVEVGNGVAFVDAREAVGGAGGVEEPGGQGRFAAVTVADKGNVADVGTFVYFHWHTPLL